VFDIPQFLDLVMALKAALRCSFAQRQPLVYCRTSASATHPPVCGPNGLVRLVRAARQRFG
jgi:hypothetical protein